MKIEIKAKRKKTNKNVKSRTHISKTLARSENRSALELKPSHINLLQNTIFPEIQKITDQQSGEYMIQDDDI